MNNRQSSLTIRETLATVGTVIYPIRGISMLPMLQEETDLVHLVALQDKPKINDVVLFERANGTLILHRVTELHKKDCYIIGDNCLTGENVPYKSILAVMQGYYHGEEYTPADNPDYLTYVQKKTADLPVREIIRVIPSVWKQTFALLRAVVTQTPAPTFPDNADWEAIYDLCESHSILTTVFPAVDKKQCPPELYQQWQQKTEEQIFKSIQFDMERAEICAEMEKRNIRYILLKGILVRNLYPRPELREFADSDILINATQDKDVLRMMKERGYKAKFYYAGNTVMTHSSYKKDSLFYFEMHTRLFVPTVPSYPYFADIWERAVPDGTGNCAYRMTDEDFYLYLFAHAQKHFSGGGTGLRTLSDLWLLENSYRQRAIKISEEACQRAKIAEFRKQILALAQKLFADGEPSYEDFAYVMSSGTYGQFQNRVKNTLKTQSKIKYLFRRLFLPPKYMASKYPVLRYLPFLLPVFYVHRIVTTLFSPQKRKRISGELKTVAKYKKEKEE